MIAMPEKNHYPSGDLAVWIFILAELLVFGLFFSSYAITRINNIELFNAYQSTLNRQVALVNTLALITSSYFVVRSVIEVKLGQKDKALRWMLFAILMGFLFIVVKTLEFEHHLSQGITLSTNTFYMFYLSLAFFHYLHVILGLIVLGVIYLNLGKGAYTKNSHSGIESGANYWHMVDLVWLILFSLVYVM